MLRKPRGHRRRGPRHRRDAPGRRWPMRRAPSARLTGVCAIALGRRNESLQTLPRTEYLLLSLQGQPGSDLARVELHAADRVGPECIAGLAAIEPDRAPLR